jgi:site-specific recombinase XerD
MSKEKWGCRYDLSIENQKLLKSWLEVRKGLPYADQLQELFISSQGRALYHQTIWFNCREYGKVAGIRIHPHQLRHTCAVDLVKAGAPIQEIKKRLGHKQITSTEFYTALIGPDRVAADQALDKILERR